MKSKILLVGFIILAVVLIFTGCNTPKVVTETTTTQTETIAPETTAIETTTTEEAAAAKGLAPENKINVASSDVTVVEIDKVSKIAPEDNITVEDNTVEQPIVSLSIFNGNGIDGSAKRVSEILEVKYNILEVGNAAHFDYPDTEIRLYTNTPYMEKVASDIEIMLRNETTISKPIIIRYPVMDELIDSDIIIVLGTDCK